MTNRQFHKILDGCRQRGKLSKARLMALPDDVKFLLVAHIVRSRGPVLIELIPTHWPDGFNRDWLNACGYLYQTKGKTSGFEFIARTPPRLRPNLEVV
jgi:hypothetical protein